MITKSDLVLRDLDLLRQINQVFAIVSFTLTTVDDDLAAILEPRAPLPSARLRAMQTLVENGIPTGVMLMPILPFIEDTHRKHHRHRHRSHASARWQLHPARNGPDPARPPAGILLRKTG